jgi:hypothetical protein
MQKRWLSLGSVFNKLARLWASGIYQPARFSANMPARLAAWHIGCCLPYGSEGFKLKRAISEHWRATKARDLQVTGKRMRQSATRELLDYWNRLRGDRPAPDRAEIDLAAIRGSLSDLFMLDFDAAHQFPFLMAGRRFNAFFCIEQLGRSFLSLWQPQDARNMAAALMTAVDAACPVLAAASAHPEGYRDADIEILFVPLRHGGLTQTRLLGIATPSVQPPWVGLLPVPHFNLRALRAVEADSDWMNMSKASTLALTARARATERPADIRGHLRVFEGGK